MDPLALDLLSKLLIVDPSKRITSKEAMNHPYFKDISKIKEMFSQKNKKI